MYVQEKLGESRAEDNVLVSIILLLCKLFYTSNHHCILLYESAIVDNWDMPYRPILEAIRVYSVRHSQRNGHEATRSTSLYLSGIVCVEDKTFPLALQ